MQIDNPELLRAWLTDFLRPLCDADPGALAKYVLALIKKDKPISDLRATMAQQMDVFLQAETQGFIDQLFKVVATKEYEHPQTKTEEEPAAAETGNDTSAEVEDGVMAAAAAGENGGAPAQEPDSTTPIRDGSKGEVKKDEERRRSKGSRSPPPASGNRRRTVRSPPRRYRDRSFSPRHDRNRQPGRRGRSRSPVRRGRPGHGRSPPRYRPRSLERYRSRSPVPATTRPRASSRDSTPTRDEGGYNPSAKRIRCRDYDERGFCLKGDLCKFDHGTDAVVLEDSNRPAGYVPSGGEGAALPGGVAPYVPGLGAAPPTGIPFPPPGIISVPPPGYAGVKRAFDGGYEPPNKRFDYNRLGGRGGRGGGRGGRGRGGGRGGGGASSMLAVRNIPPEMNSITHINAHFARFGNLQNIQINFEGDPGSCLLTYTNNDEANAAFSSPEAVMNNRFIKVYWHMDKNNVKGKLTQGNNQVVMMAGDRLTKTLVNEEVAKEEVEEKEKAILAIQKNQEMLQTKAELLKKTEEMRKEATKQQDTLIKSKQSLLDGYLEEQKKLIAKLEKGNVKPEDKKTIMAVIKDIAKAIDRTKEEIKTSLTISSVKTKSKAEIQKELLDAEMELFNRQHDGADGTTAEIQQKVNLLRLEAAKNGYLPTSRPARGARGGYRARGGFRASPYSQRGSWRSRGRGRGFTLSPGSSTLDRRPSRILVSGYELEEKDDLIVHFQKFGEIADILEDTATPSVIIKFKTRRFAEAAMLSGKSYNDRSLQLSWYNQGTPEREEETGAETAESDGIVGGVEDDYTPPQHDYLPPGLQEHEDSLSQASGGDDDKDKEVAVEDAEKVGEVEAGVDLDDHEDEEDAEEEEEEINDNLLDDDDDDEDEEDEERSWKRRNADED